MKQEILSDKVIEKIVGFLRDSFLEKEFHFTIPFSSICIPVQLETSHNAKNIEGMYIQSIVEPYIKNLTDITNPKNILSSLAFQKKWFVRIEYNHSIFELSEDVTKGEEMRFIYKYIEKLKVFLSNLWKATSETKEEIELKKDTAFSSQPTQEVVKNISNSDEHTKEIETKIELVKGNPKEKLDSTPKKDILIEPAKKTMIGNRLILVLRLRENNLAVRECIEKRNLKEINPKEFSRAILAYWNGEQSKIPANLVNAFQMQTERETLDLYYYLVSIETKDQNVIALITSNNPREREKGIEMLIKENLRYEFSNLLKELPDNCRMV